ncbi:outer membrane beta-barrel family protein [Spirosoma pollinicola]|uniref:Outer membrane protein beta-barrel domain-containing protein n=1 Tax=Spirosoma pollinicola TaxID=2057025 RepID=A0A2K8Z7I7_9BACT|nr:outer membrane beta-barrel family protein [Spirosoma pollinicola]AUD05808.1 hypothetical protein CWM47_30560 [Spirosoma pollinicola]
MKTSIILFLLWGLSFTVSAQSKPGHISGRVLDEHQKPIEFATVALVSASVDSAFVKATYTDPTGAFAFESLNEGRYRVKITFVGYQNAASPVLVLTPNQPATDMGSIALQPQTKQLSEVVVTGQKAVIEQKIDRMVLNVDALPSNAGATALDVLEKSPGVSVDPNGNVSLKGKKEVMIMLDDKLTYLSGDELVNLLRSMNASQLNQIEIMTNPSAKYDASGNAGIINIRTKKQTVQGFNGTLTLGLGYSPYFKSNDGLSMNYRSGKVNTFFNYGFIQNNGYFNIETHRNFLDANGLKTGELNQSAHRINQNQTNNLKLGMDYFASARTTLGFSLTGFYNPQRPTGETTTRLTDGNGKVDSTLSTPSSGQALWRNGAINVNARHTFGEASAGREISASADLLTYNASNAQNLVTNTYSSDGALLSQLPLRGDIPLDITIFTAKVDYMQPLGQYKFETGVKTATSNTNNQANYFLTTNGVEAPDYGLSNQFKYHESINAVYSNLSRQVGKWYGQLGLRYENTQYTGHQLGNPEKPDSVFVRHYSNLFPTLFVSYKANERNQFVVSVGRRIDRPAYRDLNPFLSIIDRYAYSTGNPFLRPQFTNNFELSHTYNNFLTTTLNYSRTDGFITETLQKQGDVIVRSVGNIAIRDNVGLAISMHLPVTSFWSANLFVNGAYTAFNGTVADLPFQASAFSMNLNLTNQFKLGSGWAAEVSGFYHGRNRDEGQAIIRSISQLSLGLSKQLWDKKASLVFNVRDVFHSQISREIQNFQNVVSTANFTRDTRVANISFVYRFGQSIKGGAARARTSAEDEKDRVKLQ